MIWLFVFCLIGIVGAIYFAIYIAETKIGAVLNTIFLIPIGIFIGAFVGFLAMSVLGLIGHAIIPSETITISETQIYSLVDSNEYRGMFVLGSGCVESEICIYYVTITPDGKRIEYCDRDRVYIVETNSEDPKVTITGDRYKWTWAEWIFPEISMLGINTDKVTLTVPNDTVTIEYSIDLK